MFTKFREMFRTNKLTTFAFLLQISILLIWCFTPKSATILAGIGIATLVLSFTLFSVEKTLLILVFYLAIIPSSGWGQTHEFFKIYISYYIIMALLILCIGYRVLKNMFIEKIPRTFSNLDKFMFAFLVWSVIAVLRGYLININSGYLFMLEMLHVLFYGVYFLVDETNTKKKWIQMFFGVLFISSIIISLEFIYILLHTFQKGMMARIVTQQPHIALITFPYMIANIVYSSSRIKRYISLAALFPTALMIIASQQRALWLGIGLSTILLIAFLVHSKRISPKMAIGIIVGGICLMLVAIQFLIKSTGTQVTTTLGIRMLSLLALEWDMSWVARTGEILRAFSQLDSGKFLIGTGFGSMILRIAAPVYSQNLDNSFAQIIWKMGVVGITLYAGIIILFLKRCMFLYYNTNDENIKIVSLSVSTGFIGLLFVALTNSVLIAYRFIIIWALLFASIEILYKKAIILKVAKPIINTRNPSIK